MLDLAYHACRVSCRVSPMPMPVLDSNCPAPLLALAASGYDLKMLSLVEAAHRWHSYGPHLLQKYLSPCVSRSQYHRPARLRLRCPVCLRLCGCRDRCRRQGRSGQVGTMSCSLCNHPVTSTSLWVCKTDVNADWWFAMQCHLVPEGNTSAYPGKREA